ncbi:MAG TPA: AsmA-like C-terminal region-containing protein, partial [Chitinophagaceae bacterium]
MEQVRQGPTKLGHYAKIFLRILLGTVVVILLLWTAIYIYFQANKASLLTKVSNTVRSKLKGEVLIRDIGLNFLVNFPNVTLRLEDVSLRDSMYEVHQHELLKADKLFISSTTLDLLKGRIQPSKIVVERGRVFLFTDGNGYTNRYLTSSNDKKDSSSSSGSRPDKIILKDVRIILYQVTKRKYHDVYFRKLNCGISGSGADISIKTKIDATINSLAFNIEKGSYAKGKVIKGDLKMNYDTLKKALNFKNERIRIGGQPFVFSGGFHFDSTHSFNLDIIANRITFKTAAGIVTAAVSKKIDSFDFAKPINLKASIRGRTVYRDTPVVNLSAVVKDNILKTANGDFEDCSFAASFTNQVSETLTRNDANSAVTINGLKASWEGIPVVSERILIRDLKYPVITCDIQSNTDLSKLDGVIGSESFQFTKGDARTKIYYHGPIGDSTKVTPYISGSFSISNAEIEYVPRRIKLSGFSGDIIFDSTDIRFKDLKGNVQQNPIEINGEIRNFFSLMDADPGKLELTSFIKMPVLDVGQFTSFLGQRKKIDRGQRKAKLKKLSRSIDRFMDMCNMNTSLTAGRITYKRFVATDVKANVLLTNNNWQFRNVSLNHADGSLDLDGSLLSIAQDDSRMNLNASLKNINISKLFQAFNNFGMDDIGPENIKGLLTTNIQISGVLNDNATIRSSTLNGTIDLSLKEGELINFEPLQKMSVFLLKKRDFSNLEFAELKNRF